MPPECIYGFLVVMCIGLNSVNWLAFEMETNHVFCKAETKLHYSIQAAVSLHTTHPPRYRSIASLFWRLIKFLTLEAVQLSFMNEEHSESLSLSVNVSVAFRCPIPKCCCEYCNYHSDVIFTFIRAKMFMEWHEFLINT